MKLRVVPTDDQVIASRLPVIRESEQVRGRFRSSDAPGTEEMVMGRARVREPSIAHSVGIAGPSVADQRRRDCHSHARSA